jgi:hypothetical protein
MKDAGRKKWLSVAILAGIVYLAIGTFSASLAGASASSQMRFVWRLSAFIISAIVFVAHITFEHFRLRTTIPATAWHASLAVDFGAFLLALLANI